MDLPRVRRMGGVARMSKSDYYADIIRQRNAADAAQILADECRKAEARIAVLDARLRQAKEALETVWNVLCGVLDDSGSSVQEVHYELRSRMEKVVEGILASDAEPEVK